MNIETETHRKRSILIREKLQDSISIAAAKYMSYEKIGLVEFAKRLDGNSRLAFRLLRGSEKLTANDLVEFGCLSKRMVKFEFE